MKKYFLILACLSLATGLQARNNIKILPAKAQTFLAEVFPTHEIRYIEAERDIDDPLTYEVHFKDGSEVEFDKNGRWYKIDCGRTPVPLKAVPQGIQDYIAKVAPEGTFITEIERTRGGYEVELNNGRDYRLTEEGKSLSAYRMMGGGPRPGGGR
ncbi:MAG: PepSY-like domain-containing protein [Rikenellaceae bacterium]|nr:PepSY-like domain-containing protein [Rikenellaceae bacterium]